MMAWTPILKIVTTSWLLHWLITTNTDSPFFAWECLFNRWPAMEFSASQVIEAFEQEASRGQRPISAVTLRQHWEVFLHSYRPPRADKGEDHLDSAMSVLRLILPFGERPNASGKWENIYFLSIPLPSALFRTSSLLSSCMTGGTSTTWMNKLLRCESWLWGTTVPAEFSKCMNLKYFNASLSWHRIRQSHSRSSNP